MTLTTGGKDFLAQYAGVGNCFAASGVSFKDEFGVVRVAGTSAVAAMLWSAQETGKKTFPIVDTKTYNDFYAANGNNPISLDDVGDVADNEKSPTPYCLAVPTEAVWHILKATDSITGAEIFASKVHVDGVYTGHYTPEDLTFCTGCKCDTVVDCGFGLHTVTVKAAGYSDWTKTRTLAAGDVFTDTPIMVPTVTPTPAPVTPTPKPEEIEISIKVASVGCDDDVNVANIAKNRYVYTQGVLRGHTFESWSVTQLDENWNFIRKDNFDCFGSIDGANAMRDSLARLSTGDKVIINTYGDPKRNVYDNAGLIAQLVSVGATESVIKGLGDASSFMLIGAKGLAPGTAFVEKYAPRLKGPITYQSAYNITFKSDPVGADIIIDGEATNKFTPETMEVLAGVRNIVLRKARYTDFLKTINVTKDETFSWTLVPTVTPVPPRVEIEVKRAELAGSIDIGRSTIPRRLVTTRKATFRMHVDNIGDLVTKYRVKLEFRGHKTFPFSSDWSDSCDPGRYKSVYIDVTMPDAAVLPGETVAFFELYTVLEAEEVT